VAKKKSVTKKDSWLDDINKELAINDLKRFSSMAMQAYISSGRDSMLTPNEIAEASIVVAKALMIELKKNDRHNS